MCVAWPLKGLNFHWAFIFASQNIKMQFKMGALSRVEKQQLVKEGMGKQEFRLV